MCRVLIYLGQQPALIYDLIYGPDNCLAHQSYRPQLMDSFQNLAGFGLCAWSKQSTFPDVPFYYTTTKLPFFDKNLYRLSKKISAQCLLAHVRGVNYSVGETISEQNAHPFKLDDTEIAFAHNGNLTSMSQMKVLLTPRINPKILAKIQGTTDSEWIYSLFLTQLEDYTTTISMDEAWDAVIKTLSIIREIRVENNFNEASPVNLFITNGHYLIVTRFVYDYGCNTQDINEAFLSYHSLWATFGEHYGQYEGVYKMHGAEKRKNILISSEPLTKDRTTWIELPEYSITKAWIEHDEVLFRTHDLVI